MKFSGLKSSLGRFLFSSLKKPERASFKKVDDSDIAYFRTVLKESEILTSEFEKAPFNEDWIKLCKGSAPVVLLPSSTEQVSSILSYCQKNKIAVVPQGGNTRYRLTPRPFY